MDDTATCFEYYGGLATKINGEVLPVPADAVAFAMREPIGVAGQIIPVELSAAHGGLEDRAGPGGRLHRRHQARRADAAHAAQAGGGLRGGRICRPAWSTSSPATGPVPARRSSAHPRRPARSPSPAAPRSARSSCGSGRSAQAGLARAGRQVAQHLLRRRRLRERGGRRALRHLHQPGRGLLRRQPRAGAEGHLQEVRGCRRREGQDDQARDRASTARPRWDRW